MKALDIMLSHGEGTRVVLPRFTTHTTVLWRVGQFVGEGTKFTIYGKPARVQGDKLQIMGDYGFTDFQGNTHRIVEIVVDDSREVLVPSDARVFYRNGVWWYYYDTGEYIIDFSQSASEYV